MSQVYNVFDRIKKDDRLKWRLHVDAIYKADSQKTNMAAEVLSKILGVKNQGGFRYLGPTNQPNLVVLFTSGEDIYWKDNLDSDTGVFLYYGDNKTAGREIHKTNLHGNEILRDVFTLANSKDIEVRKKIPPIFVFQKATGRDVKFLGLAVPGSEGRPEKEWLTAVWGCNEDGQRYQNYKAYFTILDTSDNENVGKSASINLAWLNDIEIGKSYDSDCAPKTWKKYIKGGNKLFTPLKAHKAIKPKSAAEQLPSEQLKLKMLVELQNYFIEKDRGYSFEKFSTDIIEWMEASVADIEVTRPYKDGGFDAVGKYRIFKNAGNPISIEFYVQAKCYAIDHAVTVGDTARLIARLRDGKFGVMITTSYIGKQAYDELLSDEQPIVVITGKDIMNFIFDDLEIRTMDELKSLLSTYY